jgi:hypothetical protein
MHVLNFASWTQTTLIFTAGIVCSKVASSLIFLSPIDGHQESNHDQVDFSSRLFRRSVARVEFGARPTINRQGLRCCLTEVFKQMEQWQAIQSTGEVSFASCLPADV